MDTSIVWTLNAWKLTQSDTTPFESQFSDYAVRLGVISTDVRYMRRG